MKKTLSAITLLITVICDNLIDPYIYIYIFKVYVICSLLCNNVQYSYKEMAYEIS